ncbi:MAG: hypothetical protein K6E49_01545 [Lachnospiraceae bacterium]|nr:hypothetical protein [Lachnospiraceae bacterium]
MRTGNRLIPALFTAAFIAAVFLGAVNTKARTLDSLCGNLPKYSKPVSKSQRYGDIEVTEDGRRLWVYKNDRLIWQLPQKIRAQDFFLDDIDHDGEKELVILCWRVGRFGRRRPTWVETDEKTWSQHIFIYEIRDDDVKPKWMASDIGVDAVSFDHSDGVVIITDTKGEVTKWKWVSWGLEKI